MKNTPIEWTDHSWPVLNGCRRKSAGCVNCYAERLASTRLRHTPKYKGLAVYTEGGPRWTGESRLWAPSLADPLRIRKPSRIFVADMGDLFFEGNSNEDIAAVFGVMAACPHHTFQVLTKRPERAADWFRWIAERPVSLGGPLVNAARGVRWYAWQHLDELKVFDVEQPWVWPLPNVWLGVSAEDQATYSERVPLLAHRCPAALHWVSLEPQLGPIKLGGTGHIHLGWVVQGGESGPGARPFDINWAHSMREECAESGIPYFLKQLGSNHFAPWKVIWGRDAEGGLGAFVEGRPINPRASLATVWQNGTWHTWDVNGIGGENSSEVTVEDAKREAVAALQRQHVQPIKGWARHSHMLNHKKGSDMAEWPESLRLRQFPETRNEQSARRVEVQHG